MTASVTRVPRLGRETRNTCGVTLDGGAQLFLDSLFVRLRRRLRLICPERCAWVFTLAIVAAHERPEQRVERLMIESVLRGGDTE